MSQSILAIDNQPVGFGITDPNGGCFRYDERYCQMAELTDTLAFQFKMSECGGDLVTNGPFTPALLLSSWYSNDASSAMNGWTWASPGQANHVVGMTLPIQQNAILSTGTYYKVTFTIKRVTNPLVEIVGSVQCLLGTFAAGPIVTDKSGTYTIYGTCLTNTNLYFVPTVDFDGAIDDVSVVALNTDYRIFLTDPVTGLAAGCAYAPDPEGPVWYQADIVQFSQPWSVFCVGEGCYNICISDRCVNGPFGDGELVKNGTFSTGANWIAGTGWAISLGKACHGGVSDGTISQTLGTQAGKYYTVVFTVVSMTAPSLNVSLGGTFIGNITSAGTYTYSAVLSPNNNEDISFTTLTNSDACIDNVSVKINPTAFTRDLCSDCYDLKTTHPCSRLLTWTNDNNGFNMIYTGVSPTVFGVALIHSLRLFASFEKPKFPEDKEGFRDSEGTNSVQMFDSTTVYELFIDYLPLYLHKAIRVARGYDHFYIDGTEWYPLKGDYVPEWRDRKKVAQARIEITPKTEQNLNTLC